nr:hypothetical protein [Mycobacteroides abscessus]
MLGFGASAVGRHFILEHGFDLVAQIGVKLDGSVVVSDLLLNFGDEHSFHLAVGDFLVPSQANEIRIDGAGRVFGIGDDEAAVAVSAEDRRFQVVGVFALLLPRRVRTQDFLHFGPRDLIDQWFVLAGIRCFAENNDTLVVGGGQNLVQAVVFDRSCWGFRCWSGGQTAMFKLSGQSFEGPVAAGIGMKCPRDQRGAHRINLDGAHVSTVGVDLSDVEIAKWCLTRGAADFGFLGHAFGDFDGQVAAVVLGDRTHDAV